MENIQKKFRDIDSFHLTSFWGWTFFKIWKFTYLADNDNSTIDVALPAVPGWNEPIPGAEGDKLAILSKL